jgi:hypothetical protein
MVQGHYFLLSFASPTEAIMNYKKMILFTMALFLVFGGFIGCQQDTSAENAGERMGEAAEEVGEGTEEAGEELEKGAAELNAGYRESRVHPFTI